jgi:TorA maturation chaperone TorD
MNANAEHKIDDEDILRAELYSFLAALLRVEPQDNLLVSVSQISGDDTPIGKATGTLSYLAKEMDAATIRSEYVDLFIGVGRGELLPYCSYYLTGFLNEKPLANLRQDMASIGIARAENVKDPEDHIASLCDMMAGLILGNFGRPYSLQEQATFFKKHIAPWAGLFFADLEAAKSAVFYAPVGTIGRIFMDIESQAFDMGESR